MYGAIAGGMIFVWMFHQQVKVMLFLVMVGERCLAQVRPASGPIGTGGGRRLHLNLVSVCA